MLFLVKDGFKAQCLLMAGYHNLTNDLIVILVNVQLLGHIPIHRIGLDSAFFISPSNITEWLQIHGHLFTRNRGPENNNLQSYFLDVNDISN